MEHIYQASDLSAKRRELMDAARTEFVQIRDTDGTGLVLGPKGGLDFLRAARKMLATLVTLQAAFDRPGKHKRPSELGEFAWLAAFDADDQATFRSELLEVLAQALSTDSMEPVEKCVREWKTTARALENDMSRRILTAPGEKLEAFDEVGRPE